MLNYPQNTLLRACTRKISRQKGCRHNTDSLLKNQFHCIYALNPRNIGVVQSKIVLLTVLLNLSNYCIDILRHIGNIFHSRSD